MGDVSVGAVKGQLKTYAGHVDNIHNLLPLYNNTHVLVCGVYTSHCCLIWKPVYNTHQQRSVELYTSTGLDFSLCVVSDVKITRKYCTEIKVYKTKGVALATMKKWVLKI